MDRGAPLLLAGLGHAHLFVLESLARERWPEVPVVLVTPPEYDYSGMISGVVTGQYAPEQARLSPDRLARAAGAEWIPGRVHRIDPAGRRVTLDDGSVLPFRLLSLDIGSRPAGLGLPGVGRHAIPVKPVRHALRFRSAAARAAGDATADDPARAVVVGGGAAGVEIALATSSALARHAAPDRFRLVLVEGGERILDEYGRSFRERARQVLRERGVEVRCGIQVMGAEPGRLLTRGGEPVPFDALLWATGPAAPPLLRRSGLPTEAAGYLRVRRDLRCVEHEEIFAAGDCAALEGFPWMAKAGVYAVREGPVLAGNLRRALRGEPLRSYEPQRHWLSLINTGDGRALASYRGLSAHGRLAFLLKDRIDRRFVERFQDLGS
jgi:selenide,water dikinase